MPMMPVDYARALIVMSIIMVIGNTVITIVITLSSLLLSCRMEETLLGVYGADGWRGAAKERIKLQSELDRARDQVALIKPPSLPLPGAVQSCCVLHSVLCCSSWLTASFVLVLSHAFFDLLVCLFAVWEHIREPIAVTPMSSAFHAVDPLLLLPCHLWPLCSCCFIAPHPEPHS